MQHSFSRVEMPTGFDQFIATPHEDFRRAPALRRALAVHFNLKTVGCIHNNRVAVKALDYLVKPVSEARFAATIRRLLKRLRSTTPATGDERIIVATARGAVVLNVTDIDWIEAAGNYAQLRTGARSYILRESLQVLEERLHQHGFIRAHRSALARLDGVRELERDREGMLVAVLHCGARITISRRRSAAFASALREKHLPGK